MALTPTSQLHPTALLDSLHSSLSRRLPLLRPSPSKKLHFYVKSTQSPNPQPQSTQPPKPTTQSSSKPTWLKSWPDHRRPPPKTHPKPAVDYRAHLSSDEDDVGTSRSTGGSTMAKIVEKLKKFGYIDDEESESPPNERLLPERGSVEDIFYVEDGVLPDARGGLTINLNEEVRFPWEKKMGGERENEVRRKQSKSALAELTLPEGELRRLRHMAIRMKSKIRVKGAGVTREIVDAIHDRWRTDEVVRIKCEGNPALNMRRTHEILERKTGGLVIWRSGSSVSLYRGVTYEVPQPEKKFYRSIQSNNAGSYNSSSYSSGGVSVVNGRNGPNGDLQYNHKAVDASVEKKEDINTTPEVKYEDEVDKLLDAIGPRYTDWPGSDPLPVDADLLPGNVLGYKPPFRILPYGVRSSLGLKEGTALRRLARTLPPHFALGRSRQLQGIAAAMLKLWESSSIAKIALKRGVQLTTSERMADDIKKLTGGTLLSRNKDFLVFYRGKDFLSPEVADTLLERERLAKALQDEEEKARLKASAPVVSSIETIEEPGTAGTLGETLEADARWGSQFDDDYNNKMIRATELARHADLVRKLERKLSLASYKLTKAERALAKVEQFLKPAERTADPESINDEERFMFRKLGLRMKAYLLLGRRGVFDGTVENMHLHWKYRELVKVLVNAKSFAQVKNIALSLEAESGGILVSVDKISKGFAIIVYRGKDYKRPPTLRPKNLLTKRKALARSIELQRHEAVSHHVSNLRRRVEQLRSELGQMDEVKDHGDDNLYNKLDSAYSSEEEDSEDDIDNAYLETSDGAANVESDEDHEAYSCHGGYDNGSDDEEDEDDEPDSIYETNDNDDSVDNQHLSLKTSNNQQNALNSTRFI